MIENRETIFLSHYVSNYVDANIKRLILFSQNKKLEHGFGVTENLVTLKQNVTLKGTTSTS